jgi:hypothetical protein
MSYRIDITGQPEYKNQKEQEAYEKDLVEKTREFVNSLRGVHSAQVSANTLEGGLHTVAAPDA